MKFSTLLLSSAALVVAGSAYAADLPAKKGAPAAKAAAGCPAFGAGYFAIPGGDTCLKFFGYVRGNFGFRAGTNTTNTMAGVASLGFDAMSNSDMGPIQGKANINDTATGLETAFVQAGGLTAGLKYSVTDVSQGGLAYYMGGSYAAPSLLYTAAVGSTSVTIGLESGRGSTAGTYAAWRPDVVASVSTTAGAASLTFSAASTAPRAAHAVTGAEGSGYGLAGLAKIAAGPATVAVIGAYGYGASRVGANAAIVDYDGTNYSKTSSIGVKVSVPAGNGTFALYGGQEISSTAATTAVTTTTNRFGVNYAITAAKGLTITPELAMASDGSTTTNGGYLRINRDF